jgi:hypothetical protein
VVMQAWFITMQRMPRVNAGTQAFTCSKRRLIGHSCGVIVDRGRQIDGDDDRDRS